MIRTLVRCTQFKRKRAARSGGEKKNMKRYVKTIAAMQAAVLMLSNAVFAEELFDDAFVPAGEITAEAAMKSTGTI